MFVIARSLRKNVVRSYLHRSVSSARVTDKDSSSPTEDSVDRLLASFNADIKNGGVVPVFRRALLWQSRPAMRDEVGLYTYGDLHRAARLLARDISKQLGGETKTTVAYLCGNDASHIIVQWAIWMSGNIAVPLTALHPPPLLSYLLSDSGAALVVVSSELRDHLAPVAAQLQRPLLVVSRARQVDAAAAQAEDPKSNEAISDEGQSNEWYGDADAMLIYTSGTTSKPKGVVWSHAAWSTQVSALQQAWRITGDDVVLHTLPPHHVHGQLNSFSTSLAAGARIIALNKFSPHAVWSRLLGVHERDDSRVTVYHAVPAMYAKLAHAHAALFGSVRTREYVRATLAARVRVMCCGSAPLPVSLLDTWYEMTGHRLLERYGMTEAGMALSNPYEVAGRTAACVGLPLPGVGARIADDTLAPAVTVLAAEPDRLISLERLKIRSAVKDLFSDKPETIIERPARVEYHGEAKDGVYQGELQLKGPAVFKRYWNRSPEATANDFTPDGWFRTGDTASFSDNRFRILGRTSIDIIKTGGYKVSAIEVESILLDHPSIIDVGVVGVPDQTWGERVCAAMVVKGELTVGELREWGKDKMAAYQLPTAILILESMPRNHMGKLDKKEIARLFTKRK